MSGKRSAFGGLLVVGVLLLLPGIALAQSLGAIAGTVKDTTGAVLPGLSVEASSPALIEKTRSVITDSQGNYKLLDLRPGVYTVTFSLNGFNTVKREGVELSTGFTANINVDMNLGTMAETIVVTGSTPIVDIQNNRNQQVLSRELWDALPTGKTLSTYVSLTLGATMSAAGQDVGGTKGDKPGGGASFTYHGTSQNDQAVVVDGMAVNAQTTGGGPWTRTTVNNDRAFEETTIGSGITAEQENAGILINMVPKEGGNRWTGNFALNGSHPSLQSKNLDDALIARGAPVQGTVEKLYDAGGGGGGPLMRDRLWFYGSERWWNAANIVVGSFFNATPTPLPNQPNFPSYSPDVSRPSVNSAPNHNTNIRMTAQLTQRQKFSFFSEMASECNCYFSASSTRAPEAAHNIVAPWGTKNVFQGNWTYVKGNRWMFTAGNSSYFSKGSDGVADRIKESSSTAIPLFDINTGFAWNAKGEDPFGSLGSVCCTPLADGVIKGSGYTHDQKVTATYSTGSHTFKFGARFYETGSKGGTSSYNDTPIGAVYVRVRGGVCLTEGCTPPPIVPESLLLLLNPQGPASADGNRGGSSILQTALFAQEQWTVKRLTLNLGVRYDSMNGRYNPLTSVANNYRPSYEFPAVEKSPDWKDIAPRVGVAYDLFGTGKTAVKASWGRFVVHQTSAGSSAAGAIGLRGTQDLRTWNDQGLNAATGVTGNFNFKPDCDLVNPAANGECGASPNPNRGIPTAPTTFYDPAYLTGWGSRPYVWNSSVTVQQELRAGLGLTVGFFRTTNGNIVVTDNRAITPADFQEYCVQAPTDDRLGSVSNTKLCGNYDLTKTVGANNLMTLDRLAGVKPENTYNGVDVGMNARFHNGSMVSGGVSTGQTVTDNCYTIDRPFREGYCRDENPWSAGTQVKLFGNYPLPWYGLQLSGTFQNVPGPGITATRSYSNAEIAPSLGHNLTAANTASISLLPPNAQFDPRFSQVDARLTKSIQIQKLRVQGQFDIYNLLNSNAVLASSGTYSTPTAVWPRVSSILAGRLIKFGMQLDWK